jgi:GTP-binding protein HflX
MGLPTDYIAVSARKGWGLETLRNRMETALASTMVFCDALIPYARNDLVSLWHERGFVEQQQFEAEGTHLTGRLPHVLFSRFADFVNGHCDNSTAHS